MKPTFCMYCIFFKKQRYGFKNGYCKLTGRTVILSDTCTRYTAVEENSRENKD